MAVAVQQLVRTSRGRLAESFAVVSRLLLAPVREAQDTEIRAIQQQG
jgi:hypothetical protein